MTRRSNTRAERRELLERLLTDTPELSNREAARKAGSDHKTAAAVRIALERSGAIPTRTLRVQEHGGALLAPEVGNGRATTHGAWSEQRVAPLRERALTALRQRFPSVDEPLLVVQAHRQAQLELLSAWTDRHGVVRNSKGEIAAAVNLARQLARDFEQRHDRLVELQREQDEAASVIDLDAFLDEHRAQQGEPSSGAQA